MAEDSNSKAVDLEQIRDLIDLLADMLVEKDVGELQVEAGGMKVKIRRDGGVVSAVSAPVVAAAPAAAAPAPIAAAPAAGDVPSPAEAAGLADAFIVTSPMVGTFYRAPEPEADIFADIGQHVEEGQTLCIVEAMKLMNEIVADVAGEVLGVFVENGEPVEFGQQLFAIRPAG